MEEQSNMSNETPVLEFPAPDLIAILKQLEMLQAGQSSLQESFVAFAAEQRSMLRVLTEGQGQPVQRPISTTQDFSEPADPQEFSATEDLNEQDSSGNGHGDSGIVTSPRETASNLFNKSTHDIEADAINIFHQDQSYANSEPTSRLGKMVVSEFFDRAVAIVLSLNMIFIGIQVECSFMEKMPLWVTIIDYMFGVVFIIELVLRLVGLGLVRFWCHPRLRLWNSFDFVIVVLSTMDSVVTIMETEGEESVLGNISVMRVVRVVRIVRVLRVIRVAKFFTDLRVLLAAIVSTVKTASFAFVLIALIIYMFAIAIAQLSAEYMHETRRAGKENTEDMVFFFGSLWSSVFSLYMSITGGVDWKDLAIPLFDVGPFAVFLFLLYSALMMLCVLNVLLGIFCQNALDTASTDKENIIQHQLKEKHLFVERLKALFADWDDSGDGKCSVDEFIKHLSDPKTQALLRSLEIEGRDAVTLFELLDNDLSGEVDLNEFVTGCITLRGGAKAVHVEQVARHNRVLMQRSAEVEKGLQRVNRRLSSMECPQEFQREDSTIKF